jgi:hypothetical protein
MFKKFLFTLIVATTVSPLALADGPALPDSVAKSAKETFTPDEAFQLRLAKVPASVLAVSLLQKMGYQPVMETVDIGYFKAGLLISAGATAWTGEVLDFLLQTNNKSGLSVEFYDRAIKEMIWCQIDYRDMTIAFENAATTTISYCEIYDHYIRRKDKIGTYPKEIQEILEGAKVHILR